MNKEKLQKAVEFLEEMLDDINNGVDIEVTAGARTVVFNQTLPTYKELKEALAYSLHLHKALAPNE